MAINCKQDNHKTISTKAVTHKNFILKLGSGLHTRSEVLWNMDMKPGRETPQKMENQHKLAAVVASKQICKRENSGQ
jgi:hypothetical protein